MSNERYAPTARKANRIDRDRIRSFIIEFGNRSSMRYALLCLPVLPLLFFLAQAFTPLIARTQADAMVKAVAQELGQRETAGFAVLKSMRPHNLSWCYFVDQNGNVLPVTKSFTPPLPEYINQSRDVVVGDAHYYDAVTRMDDGNYLHIGVWLDGGANGQSALLQAASWPALAALAVLYLASAILIEVAVVQPILASNRRLTRAQESGELDKPEIEAERKSVWVPAESARLIDHIYFFLVSQEQHKKAAEAQRELDLRRWKQVQGAALPQKEKIQPVSAVSQFTQTNWEEWLVTQSSSKSFIQQFLEGLRASMPEALKTVIFLLPDEEQLIVSHHFGIENERVGLVQRFSQRQLSVAGNQRVIDIGPLSLRRMGQELLLAQEEVRRVLFIPSTYQTKTLGFIGIFLSSEDLLKMEDTQSLQRLADRVSPFLYRLVLREEAEQEQWTDRLTGLRNRLYLQNLLTNLWMTQATHPEEHERRFALLFVSSDPIGDAFSSLSEEAQDACVQELANFVNQAAKRGGQDLSSRDLQLVRFQQQIFGIVLSPAQESAVTGLAGNISTLFKETQAKLGPISQHELHIGWAMFPEHASSPDDLISAAQGAVDFASDTNQPVASAASVPAGYTPVRRIAMSGDLGVLDAPALLLSINTSQRTGILTVESGSNPPFLAAFDRGKLTHAQCGRFYGANAVTEYVVLWKAGHFRFRQTSSNADVPDTAATPSLERCLMEAALAEDKYNSARKILKSADYMVFAVDDPQSWQAVDSNKDITEQERNAMRTIHGLAQGGMPIPLIWQQCPDMPSHLRWFATSLLATHKLLEAPGTTGATTVIS